MAKLRRHKNDKCVTEIVKLHHKAQHETISEHQIKSSPKNASYQHLLSILKAL